MVCKECIQTISHWFKVSEGSDVNICDTLQLKFDGIATQHFVGEVKPKQSIMSNLYLIEMEVEYKGINGGDFLTTWLEDVKYYLSQRCSGKIKQLWKVVAERKVIIIIDECASELDKMLFSTPLMKKMGDQVKVKVSPLITYEQFANNVNEMISNDTRYEYKEPVKSNGNLYYWAEFNVEYPDQTLQDLLKLWSLEAAAALGAKSKGVAVDLWKCVGQRRVFCLVCFDKPNGFDMMSFGLPIMKGNGNNVDLTGKSVISFEEFAGHLEKSNQ